MLHVLHLIGNTILKKKTTITIDLNLHGVYA